MTFVTVFTGGIAIQKTSWAIWFWQLGSCVVACVFVYFMCLETGGKSLEEVDLVFVDKDDAPGVMADLESHADNSIEKDES
jgi:hypothetical protein